MIEGDYLLYSTLFYRALKLPIYLKQCPLKEIAHCSLYTPAVSITKSKVHTEGSRLVSWPRLMCLLECGDHVQPLWCYWEDMAGVLQLNSSPGLALSNKTLRRPEGVCSQVPACAPEWTLDIDTQWTMGCNPETSRPLLWGLWNQINLTVALVVSVTPGEVMFRSRHPGWRGIRWQREGENTPERRNSLCKEQGGRAGSRKWMKEIQSEWEGEWHKRHLEKWVGVGRKNCRVL